MPQLTEASTTGSYLFRPFVVSAALLGVLLWRIVERGGPLVVLKAGLGLAFVTAACLTVWGVERATDRRWSWLGVFLTITLTAVALVWVAVGLARVYRYL